MLIDTHAHIDYYDNPEKVIEESLAAGINRVVIPGVEPQKFETIFALTQKYDCAYGAVGVHPNDAELFTPEAANKMVELLKEPKMVAIGEIGLDYHHNKSNKELQRKVFEKQLEIAKTLNAPVIVHDREAHHEVLETLKKYDIKKAVMHCFSGSLEFAWECIKKEYLIAIGGVVTFKNAKKMKEVVAGIPLSSIVVETDCPFLAPHPFRGEENSPKYLPFIAKEIANIKDITYDEVVQTTGQSALRFFNMRSE